jgi:hypothetical protein
MKLKLLTCAALVAIAAQAPATIVTLAGGAAGATFVDNTGAPINAPGVVQVGTLEGGAFKQFGTTAGNLQNVFGQNGKWAGSIADNALPGPADAFNGLPIFVKIEVDALNFGVYTYSTPKNFPVNAGGVGDTVNLLSTELDQVVPELSAPGAAIDAGGIMIGLVPEPSTSLLAGLAGLALLIRRKR